MHCQSTKKQHEFLSLQRRYWVVSRLWTRFSYSDCKKSRPWKNNMFPRYSCGNLKLVVVSKTNFLIHCLGRFPITPNQEGTIEIRDEVPSSVGANDMDTSGYQVSDLDNFDFYWEKDQLVSVIRSGTDTPFPPSFFDVFEMVSMDENTILIDEEQDKEKSLPHPTTPVSERPSLRPVLTRSCPFGTRIENFPVYVYGILFD